MQAYNLCFDVNTSSDTKRTRQCPLDYFNSRGGHLAHVTLSSILRVSSDILLGKLVPKLVRGNVGITTLTSSINVLCRSRRYCTRGAYFQQSFEKNCRVVLFTQHRWSYWNSLNRSQVRKDSGQNSQDAWKIIIACSSFNLNWSFFLVVDIISIKMRQLFSDM